MNRVVLSPAAAQDLEEIDEFTIDRFGVGQAIKLRKRFKSSFRRLVDAPLSAPGKPEYDPPGKSYRYCPVGSFVVVYEPASEGIRVARVLHAARDLTRALS